MTNSAMPSYDDLKLRLSVAESALQTIRDGNSDAVAAKHASLALDLVAADARADHIKQVLLAIRNVNQLIVSEDEPKRLIEQACENLTQTMGYLNAWIAIVDLKGRAKSTTASSGFNGGFSFFNEHLLAGDYPSCMSRAMQQDGVIVVDKPEVECVDCPLSSKYGGRAGLSCRLRHGEKTYGILAVSVPAAFAFDAEEQTLFSEVAGDLAFALHKIESAGDLRESQRELARAQAIAQIGSWRFDLNSGLVVASDETRRIYGLDNEQWSIEDVQTIPLKQYRAYLDDSLKKLINEGQPYNVEFQICRPSDKAVRYIHSIAEYDVKHNRVVGTIQDVTEKKKTNEALHQYLSMLSRTERIATVGSWEWDIEMDQVRWSKELFRIMQRDPLKGAPSFAEQSKLYTPGDYQRLQTLVARCASHGTPYELELSIMQSSGEIRTCIARGQAEKDANGRIHRLAGSLQDITDRKKAEDSLAAANTRLAALWSITSLGESDIKTISDHILTTITRMTRSEYGFYGFINDDETVMTIHAWSGDAMANCSIVTKPSSFLISDAGVWGEAIRQRETLILNDYTVDHPAKKGLPHGHVPLTNLLVVPFISQGRITSVAAVANRPSDYDQNDVSQLTAFLHSIQAIIDSKRSEEALRESEERFRQIYEKVAVGVAQVSLRLIIERANKAYCQMLGYEEIELIGMHLRDITQPDYIEENMRMQSRLANGQIDHYRMEKVFIHKSGRFIHGLLDACLVRDSQGNPSYFLGSVIDITDRRLAEVALKESEDRNRLLSDVTMEGILIHQRGVAIDLNVSMANMLGFPREKLLGKNFLDFIHTDDRAIAHENMVKEYVKPYVVRLARSNGALFFAEIESRNFKKQDAVWRVSAVRDVSERKMLEDQLGQAQKMESIGRLAGGVAHDFNNMLGVILGHAELAINSVDPDSPLSDHLQQIFSAAKRSADITQQLLAFARKQTIAPKILDLNATIEGMLKMLRRLIGEDIDLAWLPGQGDWCLRMDPTQLDQVLTNLCLNARDAISGVGKITIETSKVIIDETYCTNHTECAPGEFLLLTVSDDGCGMDTQTKEHLFEPFYTTKDVDKGTGLGLATVYGIIKQNAGFINVYSELKHGTTFRIYLPEHLDSRNQNVSSVEQITIPEHGKGETILLVEDEPAILKMTKMMLERIGYSVLSAGTPAKALELARVHSSRIDLLMTDVVMPEMNGKDLAKLLSAIHPDMQCVFMSGYTANVIAHHGVLDPAVHFIQKPFSIKNLATKVRQALEEHSVSDS